MIRKQRWLQWVALGMLALALVAGHDAPAESGLPPAAPEAAEADDATAAMQRDSLLMDVGEVLDDFLKPEPYLYQSAGMRDPFQSLLWNTEAGLMDGLPGVEELLVVGILWGARDRFALVETERGQSLILREGDAVRNGRVLRVLPDGLQLRYSHYGVVRIVTLPIVSGVEEKDER